MHGTGVSAWAGLRQAAPEIASVYAMYAAGEISARSAAQMLHVSPGTFKRWVLEEGAQTN